MAVSSQGSDVRQTITVDVVGTEDLKRFQKAAEDLGAKVRAINGQQMSKGITAAGNAAKNGSVNVSNFAYQLQDMAVQFQMGTSAAIVFSQQIPQMLVGLGNVATVIGATIAALGLAYTTFGNSKTPAQRLSKAVDDVGASLDRLKTYANDAIKPLSQLGLTSLESAESVRTLNRSLAQLELMAINKQLRDANTSFIDQSKAINNAARAMEAAKTENADLTRQLKAGTGEVDVLNSAIKANEETMNILAQSYGLTADEFGTFVTKWNALSTAVQGSDLSAIAKANDDLVDFLANTKFSDENLLSMLKTSAQLGISFAQLKEITQQLGDTAGMTADQVERMMDAFESPAVKQFAEDTASISKNIELITANTNAVLAGTSTQLAELKVQRDQALADAQKILDLAMQTENAVDIQKAITAHEDLVDVINEEYDAKVRNIQVIDEATEARKREAESLRKAEQAQKKYEEQVKRNLDNFNSMLEAYRTPGQVLTDQFDELTQLAKKVDMKEGGLDPRQIQLYQQALADLNWQITELKTPVLAEALDALGEGLNSVFADIIDGSKSAEEAFADMITGMLNQITQFLFSQYVAEFLDLLKPSLNGLSAGLSSGALMATNSAANMPTAPRMLAATPTASAVAMPTFVPYGSSRQSISGQRPGGQSGDVNITVIDKAGVSVSASEKQQPDGSRDIELMLEQKIKTMITTGALDRTMQTNFALRRKPV